MDIEPDNKMDEHRYRVVSVEKVDPPEGMPQGNWCHYVIGRGNSLIEGLQSGTLSTVTQYALEFAEGLNQRAVRGYSTYAPNKRK